MHTETFICPGGERVLVGKPCPVCGAAPAGEACGRAWRETDKFRNALAALAVAEQHYREMHDLRGDGSREAGRAWDLLRRAGNLARTILSESSS